MGKTLAYMRISTDRTKQSFNRQENAVRRWAEENKVELRERNIYRDTASGKSFDRPEWRELEKDVQPGDTIVFKDICRFTREYQAGHEKYTELLNKGVNLVFLDNPTVSTDYIRNMFSVAEKQKNRIAQHTIRNTVELLLLVELDRSERERLITVKRIRDGIKASPKKSGRPVGHLDKLTPELAEDIRIFLSDRSVTQTSLMKKHGISRNTLKKYISIMQGKEK